MNGEELDALYFKGLAAEEAGDYATAFSLFMQGAALGDDGAQQAVGCAYDSGAGVEQDKKKAIWWFKKAWKTGKQSCFLNGIALTYAEMGQRRQAVYWWRKAVALRDGEAALTFARFLMKSKRPQAAREVLDLLRMAASCKEPWEISPAGKEEAQELLDKLTPLSEASQSP